MPHGGPQALAQALYLADALHGDGEAAAVLGDVTSGCSIPAQWCGNERRNLTEG
jgi:hypothetical protein